MRIGTLGAIGGSHLRLWVATVGLVAAIGSAGYVVLGWPVGDAIYMTGITLTTVGFREVRDLDESGRFVTMASSRSRSSVPTTTTNRTRPPTGYSSLART